MKDRVVARLLPPESLAIEALSQEVGISVTTLERWSAAARLEAVVATAALDKVGQNAWCREHGLYPSELERWRQGATEALAEPGEARASHGETRADRKRIKELERELLRKDKALAETAALLVLSKKLSAIFPGGADE